MNKYGLTGKLQAQTGKGPELASILMRAAELMHQAKGCYLYVVGLDKQDPDLVWINEVWDSKEDHDNSLNIPGCRELISQAIPILAGPPQKGAELEILGGKGL